jgi:hypothetical protein
MINLYRLYADQIHFWEGLGGLGILNATNIILGGALNFTSP